MSKKSQTIFSQNITIEFVQDFHASLHIRRTDNHMCRISLSKSIHIFNKDILCCQIVQNFSQRTSHIRATDTYHIGQHHGKILGTKYFHRFSTSDTIKRRIPKSVDSAMLNACILISYFANVLVTSFILPVLFPGNR